MAENIQAFFTLHRNNTEILGNQWIYGVFPMLIRYFFFKKTFLFCLKIFKLHLKGAEGNRAWILWMNCVPIHSSSTSTARSIVFKWTLGTNGGPNWTGTIVQGRGCFLCMYCPQDPRHYFNVWALRTDKFPNV